jgi:hypothetical protein
MHNSLMRKALLALALTIMWAAAEPLRASIYCEGGHGPWGNQYRCEDTEAGTCEGFEDWNSCPDICDEGVGLTWIPMGSCTEDGGNRVITCYCANW